MYGKIQKEIRDELSSIENAGLYKKERIITTAQGPKISVSTGEEVLNFCKMSIFVWKLFYNKLLSGLIWKTLLRILSLRLYQRRKYWKQSLYQGLLNLSEQPLIMGKIVIILPYKK